MRPATALPGPVEGEAAMEADVQQRILGPLAASPTAWCGFDAEWYAAVHPECGGEAAALGHYLTVGRGRGLSPNMYFDEGWYRARNPDVAAAVAAGALGSGYEHYALVGYPSRSPHWLYDDATYAEYAPDLTDEVLVSFGCANRYDHYLKAGAREGRIAHLLFQPAIYAEALTGSPDGKIEGANSPFHHYLRHAWLGGAELRTSPYFDPAWYRAHCPAAEAAIAARTALCALHHFLTAPAGEQGDPLPEFAAAQYARLAPEAGQGSALYAHYLKHGAFALAAPAPGIDLLAYLARSPTARADYEAGRVRDIFTHYLAHRDEAEAAPAPAEAAEPAPAPPPAIAADAPPPDFGTHLLIEVDSTLLCPPDGLLLYGWMLAPADMAVGLEVVCGSRRVALAPERFVTVPRTDVIASQGMRHGYEDINCGFMAFVPGILEAGARPVLEVTRPGAAPQFRALPEPDLHGFAALRSLMERFELRYGALARGFDDVIGPAFESLAAASRAGKVMQEVVDFGALPPAPEVSVIVPLHGRIDLAEYQMALMSAHPAGIAHELIYVVDDPPRRLEMQVLAESLFARFAIPFRLVLLSRNVGYAPANNIGLGLARGRLVCLMNSDVFPRDGGWLARLARRLDANPRLGALGPLLLFEDGSVQHQGMEFERLAEFGGWHFPLHAGKGRRPAHGSGLRPARAITGACLLMARDLLAEMGGLDEGYAIGDFEDADLCLRLAARGLGCAVDMDVALHHLERQSQAGSELRWRMNLTLANAWLHERRWGAALA